MEKTKNVRKRGLTPFRSRRADGDINEFTYDAAGRMLTAVNAHSSVTFTYDAAGRIASTSQPAGDVSYAYNAASQTISRTDSANAVTYEYDTAGRMVQLGSSAFGAFGFEHDAASRMNRVLYPNGVDLDLKRDGRGRITEIAFTRSGVYLDGEMRRLDAVGNTTTRERSGDDELRFGYDTLDQLLRVSAGMSVEEVYAYDSVGNWAVDGRRHDACNRLTRDNTRTFDYDRDGNLTEIHDSGGDGSAFYEYDALGRLVSATLSSGETITYRYDAIGRRYAVSTSVGTTFTLFDGWQEIGTVEPDGSSRSMLAVGEFRLAADTASGPMYVHAGLEGSVIAITNVLGELVERYRYTAFGLLTVLDAEGEEKDSPALSPWLYHGRLFENESGLYWMRMRHYSPQLGRFLQPDPAGIAGGINLYAYSNNNPLRFFDPWGLWPAPDATIDEALKGFFGELDAMMNQLRSDKIDDALKDFFKDLDAASSKHQCGESKNTTDALKRIIDNLHEYYKNRSDDAYRAMLDEINEMMTGRNADARDWLIQNIGRPELVVLSLAIVRAYNGAMETTLSTITDATYIKFNQNLDIWKNNAYMQAESNPELGFSAPDSIYP